jgi:uncharacterized membrane protein YdcZ (DUF606 family)
MYKQFKEYKPSKALTALIVSWALIGGIAGGWFIHASAQSDAHRQAAVLEQTSKEK